MVKRTSVKKIQRRRRARKLAVGAALVVFTAGSGWWLFLSKSESGLRTSLLASVSMVVDRMDELSQAWQGRSFPGTEAKTEKPAPKAETRPAAKAPPAAETEPRPRPAPAVPDRPQARPASSPPEPRSAPPAIKPPAVDYVTDEDKKALDELFKKL